MNQGKITIRVSDILNQYLEGMGKKPGCQYICWSVLRLKDDIANTTDHLAMSKFITPAVRNAVQNYLFAASFSDGWQVLRQFNISGIGSCLNNWIIDDHPDIDQIEIPEELEGNFHAHNYKLRIFVLKKMLEVDPDAFITIDAVQDNEFGDLEWCDLLAVPYQTEFVDHPGFTVKIRDVLQHYIEQDATPFICCSVYDLDTDMQYMQKNFTNAFREMVMEQFQGVNFPGTNDPVLAGDAELDKLGVLSAWINIPPRSVEQMMLNVYGDKLRSSRIQRVFVLDWIVQQNYDAELSIDPFIMQSGIDLEKIMLIPFVSK